MNKENEVSEKVEESTGRITRARAKAQAGGAASKPPLKQDKKCLIRTNSKRASSDGNKTSVASTAGLQPKRRAVLKDVSNVCADGMQIDGLNANEIQITKQTIRGPSEKKKEMIEDILMGIPFIEEDAKAKLAADLSKIRMVEAHENSLPVKLGEKDIAETTCHGERECTLADSMSPIRITQRKEEDGICKKLGGSKDVEDIDSDLKDPRVCSLYAPDIYDNKRVTELDQRTSTNYMEHVQSDINPNMRGILIDWLVECYDKYLQQHLRKAAKLRGHSFWARGPDNAGHYNSRPHETGFFCERGDYDSYYGRFFLHWYAQSVMDHADNVLSLANLVFEETKIIVKMPAIYWWYKTSSHAAELTAGYYNPTNQDGYSTVFEVLKKYCVTVKFVCYGLQICSCENDEAFSDPEGLSWQVLNSAWDRGLSVAGENTLSCYDRVGCLRIIETAKPRNDPDRRHFSFFVYQQPSHLVQGVICFPDLDYFIKCMHGDITGDLVP